MEKNALAGVKTYQEAVDYISSTPKFTSKNTMEDTRRFLSHLGDPSQTKKIIHVAGTNGKGSVCAYLRAVMMEAGISCGMFISPHLVTMRERFVTQEGIAHEEEFLAAFQKVADALLHLPRELAERDYHPTFFEFLFFMGMVFFEQKNVEYVILETGLGGRLDATNSVERKTACVITSIGYDHMEYLGDTLYQIAGEKAGILRKDIPVIFGRGRKTDGQVVHAVEEAVRRTGARPEPLGDSAIKEINIRHKTIDFSYYINYDGYVGFTLSTQACYQVENAALALRTIECLRDGRITVPCMQRGLKQMQWEGRMEEILPGVYLDGAHNIDGIRAFLETVRSHPVSGRRKLLYSVVKDKQYQAVARELAGCGLFDEIVLVELADARALPVIQLEELFRQYTNLKHRTCETLDEAWEGLVSGKNDEDRVYIAGSLYLVGEVKALLRRPRHDQL